jgi:hypothetical protein
MSFASRRNAVNRYCCEFSRFDMTVSHNFGRDCTICNMGYRNSKQVIPAEHIGHL